MYIWLADLKCEYSIIKIPKQQESKVEDTLFVSNDLVETWWKWLNFN